MIKATSETFPDGVKVGGMCNRGEWFGKTWLIGLGCGYSTFFYVAEGDCAGSALDAYADSNHAGFSRVSEAEADENEADPCLPDPQRIGNYSEPHILEVRVLEPCAVDYFAKAN